MKIENVLLGIAIGDAFGAGVEFQDRDWIRQNVDFTQFVNARGRHKDKKDLFVKDYHAWDYTDDTEMTIGVMKALMSSEPFSETLLVQKWLEEYEQGRQIKGYGRHGHGSMSWYYSGQKTIEEVRDFQRNRNNPGNAPAMRAIPLGLVAEKWINSYAEINANATHPNINAMISSQCIARATEFMLVKRGDKATIIEYCLQTVPVNEEYQLYLNQISQLGEYNQLKGNDFEILCGTQPIVPPYFLAGINGVPSDSKYTTGCVLYVLKHSENAMDALVKSVYLGGDVDSVASITTGILAGKTGLSSLPNFMLENVEGIEYLKKIAQDFEKAFLIKATLK
jgi:ADP-ribosylglycohydrolase